MNKPKGDWWAKIREGLVRDPDAPHYRKMGNAIWVYLNLHLGADLETGQLSRTYKTISNETGIPEPTVRKMMRKLEIGKYIKTVRFARGLHIQILKWEPVKKRKRVSKYGHSESGESVQNSKRECPNQNIVSISGQSLNGQNNESKSARVSTSGRSNETHITRPNTHGDISDDFTGGKKPSKAKESKPTNPDVKILIDHYHDEFLRIHGRNPELSGHTGGRAAKEFKTLLEANGRTLEEFKGLITDYLSLKDPKLHEAGYPVPWFSNRISGLLLQKKQPERGFVH